MCYNAFRRFVTVTMNNRQLRNWVFMLYPDNPSHCKAIEYIDLLENAVYIKHAAKYMDDGTLINKEHWHCVMKFENGYWLSTLLNDLGLSEEDSHLFHSYKDFKSKTGKQRFKSLDEYADYLDHMNDDNKPDKYSIEDFHGGLVGWIQKVLSSREEARFLQLMDLCLFIRKYAVDNMLDVRTWSFTDWYKLACDNGYGALFYREWYKMRDILHSYINY